MKYFFLFLLTVFAHEVRGGEFISNSHWLDCLEKEASVWTDDAKKSTKNIQLLSQQARKMTARMIRNDDDVARSDMYADFMVLLNPVLEKMEQGDPQKTARSLAHVLYLNEADVAPLTTVKELVAYRAQMERAIEINRLKVLADQYDMLAIERSADYLMKTYPESASVIRPLLKRLQDLHKELGDIRKWISFSGVKDKATLQELVDLRRQILVEENPELREVKNWVAARRYAGSGNLSNRKEDRPANWQGISSMPHAGKFYFGEIVSQSLPGTGKAKKLFKDERWVGHLVPNSSGAKLMFTSNNFNRGNKRHWDVFELDTKTGKVSTVTAHMPQDTDSYDSCYLPDGRVIFVNTSGYQGVPCVTGSDYVGNLHLYDSSNKTTRRLTMDQDNNWFPTMLHNGRVMFLRWEYTESAHYFSRVLMHMNPDGSDQKEYYGSNSYWPNSLFNTKEIPGHPGKFIGVVSGHHGIKRVGELVLFDVNRGRKDVEGAVQKIPGYGKKVESVTKDQLVNNLDLFFAEPYPLSDKFFLASSSLDKGSSSMNVVLCDIFDNVIPLTASNYFIYASPFPREGREEAPAIPDRIKKGENKATAYITDVYEGEAMKGVPRGEAKSIRVFTSEYSPRDTGGHYHQGMESNWDVKVLYGTAPVLEDGSALFEIPADQPITVQVLDGEERALALMRSWFTAMPGEVLSCIGCHENQNESPPARMTLASRRKPAPVTPWRGPVRTFSFMNEVQPVLDRNCAVCHTKEQHAKIGIPDFETLDAVKGAPAPGSVSYWALHPYVRRNGPEGNYLGLMATEFFADTSELYQILKKGHHGVQLTPEDWDRLVTWIDMNVPYMGYWPGERNEAYLKRRYELLKQYSTATRNYVTMDDTKFKREPVRVTRAKKTIAVKPSHSSVEGFPFEVQTETESTSLDLGDGVAMKLRKIPAGNLKMGSSVETPREKPVHGIEIKNPYWMGETEVTLAQYRQFDPSYENGWYDMHYKDQVRPGYGMNNPKFPVIRVSWKKAMEFCEWLSKKTGKKVSLPTEAQWEFAARSGKETPFFFGNNDADFSLYANLGDITLRELAVRGIDPKPIKSPDRFWDFVPRDEKFNDGVLHLAPTASFKPNAFHLYDMIGNVCEWTRSMDKPYPYKDDDDRNVIDDGVAERVVRGGSWRDRPKRATSSWRWSYPGWRPVYNVGFRVVVED